MNPRVCSNIRDIGGVIGFHNAEINTAKSLDPESSGNFDCTMFKLFGDGGGYLMEVGEMIQVRLPPLIIEDAGAQRVEASIMHPHGCDGKALPINDYRDFYLIPGNECLHHNILLVGLTQFVDECFRIQIVVENIFQGQC